MNLLDPADRFGGALVKTYVDVALELPYSSGDADDGA